MKRPTRPRPSSAFLGSRLGQGHGTLRRPVESARQLLGFWELDRIERRTEDGREIPADEYAAGYLMYMPSGHMAVHLMRADRPPYAGSSPTPAEAAAAIRGYLSYFGPFRVLEEEHVVVHERSGHLEARSAGSEARRAVTRRTAWG